MRWGTAIAVAIAAVAGLFLAIRSTFDPYTGPTQLIFAFEAVVIGGLGSLWGTLAGGIVLGVAQTIGAQIDPQYSILAGHLVFLAVLASPARRHLPGAGERMTVAVDGFRVQRWSALSAGVHRRVRPLRGRARLRSAGARAASRRRR